MAAVILLASCCAGARAADPYFTEVPGSPFTAGAAQSSSYGLSFSPDGKLLASADDDSSGTSPTVSMFSVAPAGALTPVSGSPFALSTVGSYAEAIAFSPDATVHGTFLAVGMSGEVAVYSVDPATGSLTPFSNSPFPTDPAGLQVSSVAFNPDSSILAVGERGAVEVIGVDGANHALVPYTSDHVSTGGRNTTVAWSADGNYLGAIDGYSHQYHQFTVNTTGITEESYSPVTDPQLQSSNGLAFSPTAPLLAYGDQPQDTSQGYLDLHVFSLDPSGNPTEISGSPFATSQYEPEQLAFSADGRYLAATYNSNRRVEILSVAANGTLSEVPGSPNDSKPASSSNQYGGPDAVAFSPLNGLLATGNAFSYDTTSGNKQSGGVHVYSVGPPTATISSPADNTTVFNNQNAPTSFTCAESAGGPGVSPPGCVDSNGIAADSNRQGSGHLDTSADGNHTYTVQATSSDGQTSTATLHYAVIEPTDSVQMTVSPAVVAASDGGNGSARSTTPASVHVSVTGNGPTPTGSVTLTNHAGDTVATLTLDGNGNASKDLTGLSPDPGPLKATYAGANGPSATAPLRVGLDPASMKLDSMPPVTADSPVDVTGTLTASDSGDAAPSGTVTVHDGAGGPVLGSASVNGSGSAGSESFTVHLPAGLSAGSHTLEVDFADSENRFTPTSASEQVQAVPAVICYVVQTHDGSAPTRVNGVEQQGKVTVSATTLSNPCPTGPDHGVSPGGTVRLTGQPPAYETVTGFAIHPQTGGDSVLPADNNPGPGQAASATLTVSGPVSVTAVVQETDPASCPTVTFKSRWLGQSATRNDLASFSVLGAIGCTVTAPVITKTVSPGDTIQALPDTPLLVVAQGTTISPAAGKDHVEALDGIPADTTRTTPADASFSLEGNPTITAVTKMVCVEAPKLVAGTGGTIAFATSPRIISASQAGAMASVLTALPAPGSRVWDRPLGYSPACPATWSGLPDGVVPGGTMVVTAKPLADDTSLGLPAGDPGRVWAVDDFPVYNQADDGLAGKAAADMTSGTQLQPRLVGGRVASTPANHAITEPPADGSGVPTSHPVVVGARFERLGCVKVFTDVAGASRETGGVGAFGEYQSGTFLYRKQYPSGSLRIDTPSNCPVLGPGYYVPGTRVSVTATDPVGLDTLQLRTQLQHPEPYDSSTDPNLYAPPAQAAADTGSLWSLPAPLRFARRNAKSGAPSRRPGRRPLPAPRHIPHVAPPAARLVPDAAATTRGAVGAVDAQRRVRARHLASVARLSRLEMLARRRVETAELHGSRDALRSASLAWGPAEIAWWKAREQVVADDAAVQRAAMSRYSAILAARFGDGAGVPSYAALQIAAAASRVALLHEALEGTLDQAARIGQLKDATAVALGRHPRAQLRRQLGELESMAASVQSRVLVGRKLLAEQTRQLTTLTRHETRGERLSVAELQALAAGRLRAPGHSPSPAGKRTRLRARVAAADGSRPLYPDEIPDGSSASVGSLVRTPLTYQGMYADDTDKLLVQSDPGHTATFVVGSTPMTVHATWGPSTCERPKILPFDAAQVSVSVDGGAGACAGPGTVARLGTFVVNARPTGDTVSVVIVHGTAPNGTDEERIQMGSSSTFPALKDSTVQVQVCQPIEFGGSVNDTRFKASTGLRADVIDQFASVVPGTGSACALPGLYTPGSKVRFSLPSFLAQAVTARTIDNPYHSECPPFNATDYFHFYSVCNSQPPAGTAGWRVDGQDVGSDAPTVTLDANQPQHAVGLQVSVACDRLSVTQLAPYNTGGNPAFGSPSDCPVPHPDEGDTSTDDGHANHTFTSTRYYLPNEVASFSPVPGDCTHTYNPAPPSHQPNDAVFNPKNSSNAGPIYVDFIPGPYWIPAPVKGVDGYVTPDERITDVFCGGYSQYKPPHQWPDWNIGSFVDLAGAVGNSVLDIGKNIYSVGTDLIAPAFVQFYRRLDTVFTTNPFASLSAFKNWAQSVGEVALAVSSPALGALLLGADYTGALSSPGDFGNYLGQVGRFAAASGIQTAFDVAQNAGLSGAVQIALTIGDAAIVKVSEALNGIGAPSGLVTAIRSARVLTNGINAVKGCTAAAAAGDLPPDVQPNDAVVSDDSTSALTAAEVAAVNGDDLREPPPLAGSFAAIRKAGTLSEAGTILSKGLSESAKNSKFPIGMDELSLAHTLPGPNYNWTADDFARCLAGSTIG